MHANLEIFDFNLSLILMETLTSNFGGENPTKNMPQPVKQNQRIVKPHRRQQLQLQQQQPGEEEEGEGGVQGGGAEDPQLQGIKRAFNGQKGKKLNSTRFFH